MFKSRIPVIILFAVILGLYNYSIINKELLLRDGKDLILNLAPKDPRSLLQGDYMDLEYAVGDEIWSAAVKSDDDSKIADQGLAVLKAGDNGIAIFERIYAGEQLAQGEHLLRYRLRSGGARLASHAWFFQEGAGKFYAKARYGLFKVDDNGNALLSGVLDRDMKLIAPPFKEDVVKEKEDR